MKTISVIIPCYNHTASLVKSLQTLRNQSQKPAEVIIIDDGSVQPITKDMLGPAAADLPVVIKRQENAGAPNARNTGFSHATGDYVIFWDADILAASTMLAEMAHILDTHHNISFVYSDFYFGKKKMPARSFSLAALKKRNFIHSASLVRKEDVVTWDESLKKFQDWDFWLQLVEQGKKGYYVQKILFTVLPHKEGMSSWLPSFAYHSPWKYLPGIHKRVKQYEQAKKVIIKKHAL